MSVRIKPAEVVTIVGSSGSGKTSLLHCLGGLLRPQSGSVTVNGDKLFSLSDEASARFRYEQFGFVFQLGTLVPELTLRENVSLPLMLLRMKRSALKTQVSRMLDALDISEHADRRPDQVSGGQAQRAAVARAVVHHPAVVFADEPTGSLDSANSERVLDALVANTREVGASLVLVTHSEEIASAGDRTIVMRDGVVVDEFTTGAVVI